MTPKALKLAAAALVNVVQMESSLLLVQRPGATATRALKALNTPAEEEDVEEEGVGTLA